VVYGSFASAQSASAAVAGLPPDVLSEAGSPLVRRLDKLRGIDVTP
jgi:septal ring-binding cell division protein DamX